MKTRENTRTVGVEEELLLVDVASGTPRAVANRVLRSARARGEETGDDGTPVLRAEPGGALETELQQQQVETDTEPVACMVELEAQLRHWRTRADAAARDAGVRVAAVGTFPGAVDPRPVRKARYLRMAEQFGLTTSEQLTCGCHVHVAVTSDEEAVAVVDRIRVWLPSLLALSANSPFWQGQDSGYASFRAQAWGRWPSAGPTDLFGSAAGYRRVVEEMVATGVLLDEGMLYFDARLSHRYPTVEIRVADVCLDAADTVLVAALCRALVETTAQQWSAGEPAPQVPTPMLRLANWQASRYGVDGDLLDPISCRPRPAPEVLAALVATVRPALEAAGDAALVDERLADVLRRGSGARRQREVLTKTGNLVDVIADAARVTAGHAD